jgi:Tol biopolymer transport system component
MIGSDGTGQAETVLSNDANNIPGDWSRDGTMMVLESGGAGRGSTDLFLYRPADKHLATWIASPFGEKRAKFSPDGTWISYDSNESGRTEVYVRGVSSGGKWRISSDGGDSSVWRRDGREIFYVSPDGRMMSVAVRPGTTFAGSTPVPLFRIPGEILDISIATQYDVSPDGQRFLMNLRTSTPGEAHITLVSDWTSLPALR